MARERLIDTTQYEPPEPFQRVMAAIRELGPGEYLRMRHRRLPYPLFGALAQIGFSYRVLDSAEPPYDILIWRSRDAEAAAACGPSDDPPTDVTPGRCP